MITEGSHCSPSHASSAVADHHGVPIHVIFNRLTKHVIENNILPESQCGFWSGRGTMDMIFTARQLQEKCSKQQRELYAVFIRSALWEVLLRIGCPPDFVSIIRSFHEGT